MRPAVSPPAGLRPPMPAHTVAPLLCALALALPAAAVAADLDALSLESDEPKQVQTDQAGQDTKRFMVEMAGGYASDRYAGGGQEIGRVTLDGRYATRLSPALRATISARLDATSPKDPRYDEAVLTLRELYLGWQDPEAAHVLEAGRVNLREGPAYGYNPTDYFKTNALRTITTADPASLRESRLGTVMLRGQTLWGTSSLAAVYAPKLTSEASTEGISTDLGSTNDRHRGLLSLGQRWSDALSSQILLYKDTDTSAQLGASVSALVSDAVVWHAEWSGGQSATLQQLALGLPAEESFHQRLALGLTYTTATRLSLTAEYHHNGAGMDRTEWEALRATAPQALPVVYRYGLEQQDNVSRDALFFYAMQRDLGVKNLDLTAMLKLNGNDRSRLAWMELRYRMERMDLTLQWQHTSGEAGSEFGSVPFSSTLGLLAAVYF